MTDTEITPAQAAQAADHAADVLERDGWCQRIGQSETGARCFYGAISQAILELGLSYGPVERLITGVALDELGLKSTPSSSFRSVAVVDFNDHRDREAHEVVDLLRHAAKRLREET